MDFSESARKAAVLASERVDCIAFPSSSIPDRVGFRKSIFVGKGLRFAENFEAVLATFDCLSGI
ncbi:MAG: hypothetical protein H0U76_31250 [Ktedonobacteraceae bacterium]|nr:hypothetical protein [Ktedonobacteraceae bacterium]